MEINFNKLYSFNDLKAIMRESNLNEIHFRHPTSGLFIMYNDYGIESMISKETEEYFIRTNDLSIQELTIISIHS